ncbi:MAG: SDR family NAD(P)-dependent oxidoreductase [Dehalococcoidia bacterium]|nr:MAG: SDR family NAD(P)-dependent oxidoreductase [Dehalococcoidia bacterium]
MNITGNTVLITGGASGIGLGLAEAFIREGNEVLICGRTESNLEQARARFPQLHTFTCDIAGEEGRKYLFDRVAAYYGNINILVNNAGIQNVIDFTTGHAQLLEGESEIDTNLVAPIYLSARFIPLLLERKEAAIINVSSQLAFVPLAFLPVYCATKAAVHSFTLSLRHQLRATSIKVFELMPPRVDTDLGKGPQRDKGHIPPAISVGQVVETTMNALKSDKFEILVGSANELLSMLKKDPDDLFKIMNGG